MNEERGARDLKRLVARDEAERRSRAASAGLSDAARIAGLLDVALGSVDTPTGRLLVAVTPRGLVRLAFPDEAVDEIVAQLADRISPRILESASATDEVRRELDQYFDGSRTTFGVPLDWRLIQGFARRTLRATAKVPFGSTTTYGDLAYAVGSPRAARAVGNALGSNPIPIVVPCHRVLRAGGSIGGYGGGVERKRLLLSLEGSLPDEPSR